MNPSKWNVVHRIDGGWVAYPPYSFSGVRFRRWRTAWDYAVRMAS